MAAFRLFNASNTRFARASFCLSIAASALNFSNSAMAVLF